MQVCNMSMLFKHWLIYRHALSSATVNCQSSISSMSNINHRQLFHFNFQFFFFHIFRSIMKLLLGLLDSQNIEIITAVIHTLSKILRSERMKSSWCNFLELILLKILDCYKTHKDVNK